MKRSFIFMLIFLFYGTSHAATYYAGPSGATTWPNCTSSGSPCSLSSVNSNITGGNTVILNPGTYSTQIKPSNSGSSGSRITYQSSSSGTVTIQTDGNWEAGQQCIRLVAGQNYVTIEKGGNYPFYLIVTSAVNARYIDANNADNLIIDGIEITNTPAYTAYYPNNFVDCDDLIIRNCIFNLDEWTYDTNADMVRLQGCNRYEITGNVFGNSPHASLLLGVNTRYGRVHSNIFSNYWRHGLNIEGYSGNEPDYLLIENNWFDQIGKDGPDNPHIEASWRNVGGIETDGDHDIIRFNEFDRPTTGYFMFSGLSSLSHVWVYHNTFYNTKDYYDADWTWIFFAGCVICDDFAGDMSYHRIMNNIFWEGDPRNGYDINLSNGGGSVVDLIFSNNILADSVDGIKVRWLGAVYSSVVAADAAISGFSGNLQVDPGLADPVNQDFSLTANSQAREAGAFLATVVSKSVNTVTVGDYEAESFVPLSWGMPNWTGDTIYDDDGDSYVVLTRPAHNQIGLDDATNIQVGDKLTVVHVVGNFPDIGAHEFGSFPANQAPIVVIDSPSGSQSISVDGSVSFSCTATDSDGTISSYNWDFDGAPGLSDDTNEDPGSKTFTAEGNYNVCVTVTDNDSATDTECVLISVGTPSGPTPYYEWNFENDLTDDQSNDNLTDGGTITFATGSEPDPPGYGTYHAILDGSTDYASLANGSIGNAIGNGTDQDFTVCTEFAPDSLSFNFVVSLYDSSIGERKWAIKLEDGNVGFLTGYNGGASYNSITVGPTFSATDDIIVCLSFDGSTNTYGALVQDVSTGTFYYKNEDDQALSGTYNTGSTPDLIVGGYAGLTCCFYDGNIYWVHIFDEKLTRAQMEAYAENTSAGNITRVYSGQDGTFTTDETFHIYVDSTADLTVDKSGGTPYIEGETGGTDIQCPLQTANGSGINKLDFLCTVSAGMASSDLTLTANEIQLNSGSITGGSLDCPDSGPGSLQYESAVVIDTSGAGTISSMTACDCDTGANVTQKQYWKRGETGCIKLCFSGGSYSNDGPLGNIALSFNLDVGGPLVMRYAAIQPSGFGAGNTCWIFEADIEDGMEDYNDIAMTAVSSMDRDYITTGTDTIIVNGSNEELSSYNVPQTAPDPNYEVEIWGGDNIFIESAPTGSVTFDSTPTGSITFSP